MKAEDIHILDVKQLCSFTDVFVFLTGTSRIHLRALAKRIQDQMRDQGVRPMAVDGLDDTGWIVLDYGDVVAHLFINEARRYYNLERLWSDGAVIEWEEQAASA